MEDLLENNPRYDRQFSFIDGKKYLLITAGDSWTWGDSLGDLSVAYRSKHLYGNYISKSIDADWINYGHCGGGNNSIIENLEKILSNIDKKSYNKIYVVVTLTEVGRDFHNDLEKNLDLNKSVEQILFREEQRCYHRLQSIRENFPNLIVARNFTIDFPGIDNSCCLEKNWVQINFEQNSKIGFDNLGYDLADIKQHGPVSGIAFNNLPNLVLNPSKIKRYMMEQIDAVEKLWIWLRNNPLNYSLQTCHPTEKSHKLWADYILDSLNKYNKGI